MSELSLERIPATEANIRAQAVRNARELGWLREGQMIKVQVFTDPHPHFGDGGTIGNVISSYGITCQIGRRDGEWDAVIVREPNATKFLNLYLDP